MSAPRLHVLTVLPDVLDVNSDSSNATVLRVRASWEGIGIQLDSISVGERIPVARPDLVLVGSGADEDLEPAAAELRRYSDRITGWMNDGSSLLAIGTGWDLLAERIEIAPGRFEDGSGLFSGTAALLPQRASGDLVTTSTSGVVVGFENHSRGYLMGAGELPLGINVAGIGNGDGREGAVRANAMGTHLHGPLLARNPGIADELLDRLLLNRHGLRLNRTSERTRRADELARRTREDTLGGLGIAHRQARYLLAATSG